MKKIEQSLREQWDTINRQKCTLFGSPKKRTDRGSGEETEGSGGVGVGGWQAETRAKNFSILMKYMYL